MYLRYNLLTAKTSSFFGRDHLYLGVLELHQTTIITIVIHMETRFSIPSICDCQALNVLGVLYCVYGLNQPCHRKALHYNRRETSCYIRTPSSVWHQHIQRIDCLSYYLCSSATRVASRNHTLIKLRCKSYSEHLIVTHVRSRTSHSKLAEGFSTITGYILPCITSWEKFFLVGIRVLPTTVGATTSTSISISTAVIRHL